MKKPCHVEKEDPILSRITDLLLEQGKSQQDLMMELDLQKSSYSAWKMGKSKSYLKYLPRIAAFLDVSQRFLAEGEANDEDELVDIFRGLDEEKKDQLLVYARRIRA